MNKQYGDIGLFLLIAFLLPFLFVVIQSIITNNLIKFVFYGIEAASPSIAAVILLGINREWKEFFEKMFHTKHLAMAAVFPVILACFTMFLAKLLFCFFFRTNFLFGSISFIQFIIIAWAFIAEEIGWRGYLETALKKIISHKWTVPFIVGIVWCLWHYHYFLLNRIQVPVLLFFAGCIIESYIYSFLMDCTDQNLLSSMTYHFSWNLAVRLFAVYPADNNGNIVPYIILIGLEILIVLIFLFKINGSVKGE